MDIERTSLPGIGTCRTFTSAAGTRVGVIAHDADGRRVLIHSTDGDPDAGCCLALTPAEAVALAGLLGIFDVTDAGHRDDRLPAPDARR
ncbi:potassium transporter TrkA [Dactylosporangium salmoneum]|uniref:Potassium/proton antiporter subunit KhtT-like N-terminal domain-containing protein n=1 Tax=Dactylosporangium salmoneum TaxID=53361 RepID=A0ABN3GQQ6_9ACTN